LTVTFTFGAHISYSLLLKSTKPPVLDFLFTVIENNA